MCVAYGCFGNWYKTYPIYNLQGEFIAYTEEDKCIPDSIPNGEYVIDGYRVYHNQEEAKRHKEIKEQLKKFDERFKIKIKSDANEYYKEITKENIDSIAVIAAINGIVSDGMYIINGKKCIIAHNDSIKIVNGKIVYNK